MAIAFDTAGGVANNGSASSISWSHACSGLNRKLFVMCFSQTGGGASSVTFNGAALTLIDSATQAGVKSGLWYMDNPDVGNFTVQCNFSGAGQDGWGASESFTGCALGIDNHTANNAVATSLTMTLTPVVDKCWIVAGVGIGGNNGIGGTGSTTVRLASNNGNGGLAIGDTNGQISPAASTNMGFSWSGTQNTSGIAASFAPQPAAPSTPRVMVFQAINRSNQY